MIQKPISIFQYTKWIHLLGFMLSLIALYIAGLEDPNILFPVAIGVVTLLSINTHPPHAQSKVLEAIRGGITTGGMWQGAFIKSMFGTALVYASIHPILFTEAAVDVFSLLLGTALLTSSMATATEARAIGVLISQKE